MYELGQNGERKWQTTSSALHESCDSVLDLKCDIHAPGHSICTLPLPSCSCTCKVHGHIRAPPTSQCPEHLKCFKASSAMLPYNPLSTLPASPFTSCSSSTRNPATQPVGSRAIIGQGSYYCMDAITRPRLAKSKACRRVCLRYVQKIFHRCQRFLLV